jgi:hypothetical protein
MLLTQRIFWTQIDDAARRRRMLAFLATRRALCHEVSFFTEGDGCDWRWLPPQEIDRRAALMGEAVQEARALGFAVAVNVLNTMGHSDEVCEGTPLPAWRRMVGHDGSESLITPCPQDPAFLAYVERKYRAFAGAGADRYWIDDDLRLHNHSPVRRGCFCPVCLASLGRRLGRSLDRTAMAEAVEREAEAVRAWEEHEGEVLGAVIDTAVAAVRAVRPTAEVGLMVCDPRDHRGSALRLGAGGHRPWLRPGGGFWGDDEPRSLLRKLASVQAQCSGLPEGTGITYEIENYPFAIGGKSAAMTGWECLLAILSGRLDGIMFDILDGFGNDPASHGAWLDRLADWVPHLQAAERSIAGTRPVGWRIAGHQAQALLPAGLPLVGGADGSLGAILTGAAAERMDAAAITRLLERPLILDGAAAARYLALGLGERIGITGIAAHGEGVHEVFTAHPVNGDDAGQRRAFTLRYFGASSHALALAPGVQALSRLVSTAGRDCGAAAALYAPTGRPAVAVLGHAPWTHVLSASRVRQLGRLSAAMLGTALPMAVAGGAPLVWWCRQGGGRTVAVLANPGFDAQEALCSLPAGAEVAVPLTVAGAAAMAGGPGTWRCRLPPWSVAVLAWPDA